MSQLAGAPPPPYPPPPRPKSSVPGWLIVVGIAVLAFIALFGVLVVLGIHGTRKYIANAKMAEARSVVGQISRDAVAAFESRGALCPSASSPVPAAPPRAAKYQSSASDWDADRASDAGFACLKFSMATPQYYQYDYRSTPAGFLVTARGDLDGDGVASRFEVEGRIQDGRLIVAPAIRETNPEE